MIQLTMLYLNTLVIFSQYVEIARVPKTEFYKESFSYRGAKHWHSLPHNLKASKSKKNFKKLLLDKQTVN
jgi:hypothetical protein